MSLDYSTGVVTGQPILATQFLRPWQQMLTPSGYEVGGANYRGYAHAEIDRRAINWTLARQRGLAYKAAIEQVVTMPVDSIPDFHALLLVDDTLIGGTVAALGSAAYVVRFTNLDDLTQYDIVSIPVVGGSNNVYQMAFARTTGLCYFVSNNRLFSFNPKTLALLQYAITTPITGEGGGFDFAQTIATDETYLYVANYTFNSGTTVFRYLLADPTQPATTLSIPNNSQAHHLTIGQNKLYVNGRETTLHASKYYAWVGRIDLGTFTLEQTANLGTNIISTKNTALVGDYLFMGMEAVGQMLRVRATDLTQQQVLAIGGGASFAAIQFDGRYVWAGVNNATNNLFRIEPETLKVDTFSVAGPGPQTWVGDVISDGARLFIQFISPTWPLGSAQILRTALPATVGSAYVGLGGNRTIVAGTKGAGTGVADPLYGWHVVGGGARVQFMAAAGQPSAVVTGPGSASATYYVVAIDAFGNHSPVGTALTINTAPNAFGEANFVDLRWAPVDGAVGYDVLKGATSARLGNVTACRIVDSGQATSGYTPPVRNETADLQVDGFLNLATYTPSSTADALGKIGDCCRDDTFVYQKTAAGWKRSAAFSTF